MRRVTGMREPRADGSRMASFIRVGSTRTGERLMCFFSLKNATLIEGWRSCGYSDLCVPHRNRMSLDENGELATFASKQLCYEL